MRTLEAGPITAAYENGFLRRISFGQTEVLRMIYFALRDHNWNTIAHHVENENIILDDGRFEIRYECQHTEGGVTILDWKASIEGKEDGTLIFEIRGTMRESFRKNRCGFCVLHPLNIIGEECRIRHPEGTETTHVFPVQVSPDNPFKNITNMSWKCDGIPFVLDFEGDIFETEDQRNWCDASFKTFCTPLDRPFPVELKKGDHIYQRVTFRPAIALAPAAPRSAVVTLQDVSEQTPLPQLGIGASTEVPRIGDEHLSLIRALRLSHYRIDLYAGSDDFALQFSNAYETAYSTGLSLEVALHLTEKFPEEMEAFMILCQQNKVRLKKVLVLSTNAMVTKQEILDQIVPLKGAFPRVLFGSGTNYNFNEINKNRFDPAHMDYVCFSADPQEHATDDLTILENSDALEHLVKSARSIYGNMAVHVSPLTLRKRFNPYATNPADLYIDEHQKADPRQKAIFAAAWTFACVASLTKGGANSVTLFQTVGEQGVISRDGRAYPVYDVIKRLCPYQGRPVTVLRSSDPLSVTAMLIDGKVLAMANIGREPRVVRWKADEWTLASEEVRFESLNRS